MAAATTNISTTEAQDADFPWNLFEQKKKLGYGKYGTVYKVKAKFDQIIYALKQTHFPPTGEDFDGCMKEITVLSQLTHPHIVRYFTAYKDNEGKVYIQMELCGNDLKVWLDDSNLTINVIRPQAKGLFDQLLRGVDYIHSQKLIHRDLKPSNIFVMINGEDLNVKIGDFGLASFEDDEMTSRTGAALYNAPEQESNCYNNKVDMYTLGIVLFEILKKKYESSVNWVKCIKQLRKNSKCTLEEFGPYEPKGWKQLISTLLERDPEDRPTAKYILDNLNSMLAEDTAKIAAIPKPNTSETTTSPETPTGPPTETTTSPETPTYPQTEILELNLPERTLELKPRRYQTELATPGMHGMNSIICAPTGCGKTIVAVMIIRRHIEIFVEEKRPFKIVFLANDVRLVTQQQKCLKDYLSTGINIECMSGEDSSKIPFSKRFETNDILVVTPMILLNSLAKEGVHINQASLIIFDECHHTDKNHPYMEIMTHYLSFKIQSGDKRGEMPQIIGLSASIGVGTGKTRSGATSHVLKICGHLDAEILKTVRENVEELAQNCNSPTPTVLNVPRKSVEYDIFVREVTLLMKKIEEKVNQERDFIKPEERANLVPSVEKGANSYTQWSKQLEDVGERAKNERLVSYSTNLYAYNEALQLYEDLRPCDAQNHLWKFFEKETSAYYSNETDSWLKEIFESAMVNVNRYTESCGQPINPKLKIFSDYLLNIYTTDPESKVIVFTTTRFHTFALMEWLKENDILKDFVKPERLVGAQAKDNSGGITRNDQLQTIEKFKTGEINILFATDAAREGIDIEDCNAVINYSHKTNVIGMVQKRGRARKLQSKYTIIAEERSESKAREKINIIHEQMMYESISEVQELQEFRREEYNKMVQNIQKDVVLKAVMKQNHKPAVSNPIPDELRMLCKKCNSFVLYASSLRTFLKSNHTANVDLSSNYVVKDHPSPQSNEIDNIRQKAENNSKIYCATCGIEWGVIMKLVGLEIPIIKIGGFKFELRGKIETLKKWKDFPYNIPDEDKFINLLLISSKKPDDFTVSSQGNNSKSSHHEKQEDMEPSLIETKPAENGVSNPSQIGQYPMNKNPRGICIIISNTNFQAAREAGINLGNRDGSFHDVEQLSKLFNRLKFEVKVFEDLTALKMFETSREFASVNHDEFDCFVCCILTHGLLDGLYGIDGKPLRISNITGLYNGSNCPSLGHKPKLFFVQSCRGDVIDKGYSKDGLGDGSSNKQPIDSHQQILSTDPLQSDFFIGYSTPRGYVAWRYADGPSWYIETMCEVFNQHAAQHDLLTLMTIVNNEVSKRSTPEDDRQIPEPTYSLRMKLYFNP